MPNLSWGLSKEFLKSGTGLTRRGNRSEGKDGGVEERSRSVMEGAQTRRSIRPPLSARGSLSSSMGSESPPPPDKQEEVQEEEDHDVWLHSEFYAAGGEKKKALQALSKDMEGISIHEVQEVQKISSGTRRVDVKLEYYRDHFDVSDPLQRTVEQDFMCGDRKHNEMVVNVAKLRSKGRAFASRSASGQEDGEISERRPQSQMSSRPMSPRSLMTPDFTLSARRDRAVALLSRVEHNVDKARRLQLDQRIQHLEQLQRSQGRHDRAKRERPWMTVVAAVVRLAMMHKFIVVFRHAQHTIHGKVEDLDVLEDVGLSRSAGSRVQHKSGRMMWQSAKVKVHGGGCMPGRFLRKEQMESIERGVQLQWLEDRKEQKANVMWKAWRKTLRLVNFIIKIRRPLRRHIAAERVKAFLDAASSGFLLRTAVKKYIKNVKLVQRAVKHQARVLRILRDYILKPTVWEIESTALGEIMQIPQAVMKEKIENYMEEKEVELWKAEFGSRMASRTLVWRGLLPPCPAVVKANFFRKRQSIDTRRVSLTAASLPEVSSSIRGGVVPSTPSSRAFVPSTPKETLQTPHGVKAHAPLGPPSPLMGSTPTNAETPRKRGADAKKAASGAIRKRTEKKEQTEDYTLAFSSIDAQRLDSVAYDEVVARYFSQVVDTWWAAYKRYQSSLEASRNHWIAWRKEVQMCIAYDAALLPEPPDVLTFPELIDTNVNLSFLRSEVDVRLREKAQAIKKEAEEEQRARWRQKSQPRRSLKS